LYRKFFVSEKFKTKNMVSHTKPPKGSVTVFVGCMFSGKTSSMLESVSRHERAGRKSLVIGYDKDNRYDTKNVCTHDGRKKDAKRTDRLMKLLDMALHENVDVIGIDEGQFFEDLVEFCETCANSGKLVVVAALDCDFLRRPFGKVKDLISVCEHLVKKSAVCVQCGDDAHFTARLDLSDMSVEKIGGEDEYTPMCRYCHVAHNTQDR
jgi:thymidine kinase